MKYKEFALKKNVFLKFSEGSGKMRQVKNKHMTITFCRSLMSRGIIHLLLADLYFYCFGASKAIQRYLWCIKSSSPVKSEQIKICLQFSQLLISVIVSLKSIAYINQSVPYSCTGGKFKGLENLLLCGI
jgi:hypothetical protein